MTNLEIMLRIALISVIGLISLKVEGQHLLSRGFQIHIVPISLLDKSPRLRAGFEYHHDKFGYGLDIGWGNRFFHIKNIYATDWGPEYSYFEIRPEVKWYRAENSEFEKYFSGELLYTHTSDQFGRGGYYPDGDSEWVSFDSAFFRRDRIGMLIKGGVKGLIAQRFVLDFSSGFGVTYRNNKYTKVINPHIVEYLPAEWFPPTYTFAGEKVFFQLAYAFKLGFMLGRRQ